MSKVYWFIGQRCSGKTTIARRLKYWLQTDKKNWRKSVFHIDENDIAKLYNINYGEKKDRKNDVTNLENKIFDIAKYLKSCDNDVVVSSMLPYESLRNEYKSSLDIQLIYCHSKSKIIPKEMIVEDFEYPIENHIHLDTSGEQEETFKNLIKIIV
jgi:adenylylsulfate kinase-like enzyme